jgi:hypothetical protein
VRATEKRSKGIASPAFDGEALAPEIAVGLLGGAVVDGTVPGDDGVDEVAVHGAGSGFEAFKGDGLLLFRALELKDHLGSESKVAGNVLGGQVEGLAEGAEPSFGRAAVVGGAAERTELPFDVGLCQFSLHLAHGGPLT